MFRSGWVLDGRHPKLQVDGSRKTNLLAHTICNSQVVPVVESPKEEVASEKINMMRGLYFFELEELASIGPKRCSNCNECTRCGDKNYELSKRERRELQMIRRTLFLIRKRGEYTSGIR